MPTNEEGEFELVLGNKQLLSVFFIVVVLLGVFFTMGYIVGRNMSPAGGPQMASNVDSNPLVVEPAPQGPPPAPTAAPDKPSALAPPPDTTPAPAPAATAPPKPEPAKPETAKTEPPKPAPAKVEPPKPAPAKAESPKPAPPKPEPAKPAPAKPTPASAKPAPPASGGTYLQIAATKKADADMMAAKVSKQGFRVTITPVPDSELFRVLVGPAASPDDLNKMRADLAAIGFKGFPRKM